MTVKKSDLELSPFDVADYLDTSEMQSEYLSAAFETGDPAYIRKALATLARARHDGDREGSGREAAVASQGLVGEWRSSAVDVAGHTVGTQSSAQHPAGGMTEELTIFDPADHLTSDQAIADFMSAALETKDPGYIAHALGVVARARGISEIARRTGLSREQLYRSFSSEGNPTLRTTLAVLQAVGIQLLARQVEADKA